MVNSGHAMRHIIQTCQGSIPTKGQVQFRQCRGRGANVTKTRQIRLYLQAQMLLVNLFVTGNHEHPESRSEVQVVLSEESMLQIRHSESTWNRS